MPSQKLLSLVDRIADEYEPDYESKTQLLAWRIGFLTALLAGIAERNAEIEQELVDLYLKSLEDGGSK